MTIPQPLIGWGALLIGLFLAFIAPPGRRGRWAVLSAVFVFGLFVTASFFLWPLDPDKQWNWLLPGALAGIIGVLIRDVRRWARYFQNITYRMRHPYFWYSRLRPRRRRRS